MRLSRASTYAIGAVLQLADMQGKGSVPCSQLAKLGEMPERYLLQVLRNLVNHGILQSTRGVDGGYYLARPISEITLLEVVEATDGPQVPIIPPLDAVPETARKEIQRVLNEITKSSSSQMSKVTLAALHLSAHEKELTDHSQQN